MSFSKHLNLGIAVSVISLGLAFIVRGFCPTLSGYGIIAVSAFIAISMLITIAIRVRINSREPAAPIE